MGLAASQARFLQCTARKTNIEYQGQQINNARTVLANKSANAYNEMLALKVPTPPSQADYTKVQYAFKLPGASTKTYLSEDEYNTIYKAMTAEIHQQITQITIVLRIILVVIDTVLKKLLQLMAQNTL